MSRIVEELLKKKPFLASGSVTLKQVKEAEKVLGVKFAKDYTEYLLEFGAVSYFGHELTGICGDETINVVNVTTAEKSYCDTVPASWYVIEEVHMDGIIIWQDKEGNIYKDVNLGRGEIDLHTAVNNDFYGEPDSPISDDIKVSVIKSFNKNKERER